MSNTEAETRGQGSEGNKRGMEGNGEQAEPNPMPAARSPRPEKRATVRIQLAQHQLTRLSLVVVVVVGLLVAVFGYRVFKGFKSQRDIVIGKQNLLALYKAMGGYAQDWDGHLPPADTWTDAVQGRLSAPPGTPGGKDAYLHGPGDGETVSYVYNDLAANQSLEASTEAEARKAIDPSRLVLLIERPGAARNAHVSIPPQGDPAGDAALAKSLSFPHFSDDPNEATTVVLYANGHIDTIKKKDLR